MESIIITQLTDYLQGNKLITKHRHCFLVRHSTYTSLLETVNDWTIALHSHHKTDAIEIDIQKAFYSVSHSRLLTKLSSYNIRDMFAWIVAHLNHRLQRVTIAVI